MSKNFIITSFVFSILLSLCFGILIGHNVSERQSVEESIIPLPDGRTIRAPAGHKVKISFTGQSSATETGTLDKSAEGRGKGGYKFNHKGLVDTTNIDAPLIDLTEGQEKGSGGALASITKGAASGSNVLIFAGIAFIAAGVLVIVFLKNIKLGGILAIVGGIFIGIALLVQTYPEVLLIGFFVVIGVIGYFLYRAWKNGRLEFAARKVIGAVEQLDTKTQNKVKKKVKESAANKKEENILKKTISKEKEKINS